MKETGAAYPLIEQTMKRLEDYCAVERGRQEQVAKTLLVAPSQVCRWLARGGVPRLPKFCELIDFLDAQIPTKNETQ